ncbi:hypothetical protein NDU88_007808 [Pleurodeles waltl]|uniref:Secreted protein n=1 Tax=Pleurodeles waltl TaxID=8319 RepID=A0AAV7N380_PLEWA|nr:hypothetical protein NDU88_007808 [Pleurodeles waltl]
MLPGSAFSSVGGGGPRSNCTATAVSACWLFSWGQSSVTAAIARCGGLRAAETGSLPAPDIISYYSGRWPPCRRGGSLSTRYGRGDSGRSAIPLQRWSSGGFPLCCPPWQGKRQQPQQRRQEVAALGSGGCGL